MFGAELIDFVVQFVSDPEALIVLSVVKYSLIDILFPKLVYYLHLIEVNQCSVRCATRNVLDHVSLDAHFHLDEVLIERNPEMEAGTAESGL